ncbi:hypothetical protein EYF80_028234 [Liparis tanakae]|uniref:Uncharacterized protein n=1 Tax=Liparis tanakae TaxID=230148 RepID=A0A4Z2H6S6_9TELE|nr:hypothetical protein EYF80_028234 [Liparis tanakae]
MAVFPARFLKQNFTVKTTRSVNAAPPTTPTATPTGTSQRPEAGGFSASSAVPSRPGPGPLRGRLAGAATLVSVVTLRYTPLLLHRYIAASKGVTFLMTSELSAREPKRPSAIFFFSAPFWIVTRLAETFLPMELKRPGRRKKRKKRASSISAARRARRVAGDENGVLFLPNGKL